MRSNARMANRQVDVPQRRTLAWIGKSELENKEQI